MGKSNKYTRKIIVDDVTYRYWVDPGNNVNIYKDGTPSNTGIFSFHVPWGQYSGDDGWGCPYCKPEPTTITPKDVRHVILFGLQNGWNLESEDGFCIEGFYDDWQEEDPQYMSREEFYKKVKQ